MERFVEQEFEEFEDSRRKKDFITSEKEHMKELEQIAKRVESDGKE